MSVSVAFTSLYGCPYLWVRYLSAADASPSGPPYKPQFLGFPISTIKTRDKVSRYGTENDFDYSDKPAFKKRGKALTVAIFASVPKMY